jgi:subtilisin family serine protease
LVGTEGQDFIDCLGGSDIIDGGAGIDYLVVFENSNNISLSEINGIFRLSSRKEGSDYYTGATKFYNVENLLLTNNNISLAGSDLTNLKSYGVGANSIAGTQLDDIFDGGGGSDIIDGQLGHDTAIFFTSINDAKVEIDSVNNKTTVAYQAVDQEEYAFSETILYSIEKIKFIDGEYDILTGDLFEASLSSTQVVEGGEAVSLQVQLTGQPSSDVSVSISSDGLIFDNSQMVFTSSNWHTPQTIAINTQDNETYEGDRDHSISFDLESDDVNFNLTSPNKLTVTVQDDEEPLLNNFIQGRLWEDRDKDGQIDTNENGLANLEVFIDANNNHIFDGDEASVTSDTEGHYRFSELDVGTYSVGLVSDFGWQYTFPSMTAASAIATSLSETVENFAIGSTSYFQDVSNSKYSLRPNLNTSYSDLDGTGQTVVVIDSGIDTDHSFFGDRITFSKTFGNGKAKGEDIDGHGTHVAGIIASSDDQFSGVAPNANIIALKVFDTAGGNVVQQALQWCVANAAEYSIDAVNLSLGYQGVFFQTDEGYWLDSFGLDDEFSALSDLGVVCVAAAGNDYDGVRDGQTGELIDYHVVNGAGDLDWYTVSAGTNSVQGISAPAAYPEVISVGATWGGPDSHLWGSYNANNGAPNAGSIVHFSQRDDDLLDVVAYGGGITSADMGGGSVAFSGTSMAAPYVTGLVLLMQEAAEQELGRKLSVDEIKTIINTSSNQNFDGDNENYTTQSPSNVSYNEASINNWIDQIAVLKDPQFHSVNLNQGQSDRNFGLVSAKTNAFTNKGEQVIVSTAGTETFAAGGNDYLIGSVGSDKLHGGYGDDIIEAGAGDDTLYGGQGDDVLTGGAGFDTFSYAKGDGNDLITDFDAATDTLDYTGYSDQQKTQFVRNTAENGDTLITLTDDAIITLKHSNSPAAGNVTITGGLLQGELLKADISSISDADGLGVFSYQWQADGNAIVGANAVTYTLTDNQVGQKISVVVSYYDSLNNLEEVISAQTTAVTNTQTYSIGSSEIFVGQSGQDIFNFKKKTDESLGHDKIQEFSKEEDILVFSGYDRSKITQTLDANGSDYFIFTEDAGDSSLTIENGQVATSLKIENLKDNVLKLPDSYLAVNDAGELSLSDAKTMIDIKVDDATDFKTNLKKVGDSMASDPINLSDVLAQLKHIIGLRELKANALQAGDTNNDGEVNLSDVLDNLKHIIGLRQIDTFDLVTDNGFAVNALDADSKGNLTLVINGDADQSHADWDFV